jgi:hypothetical protein
MENPATLPHTRHKNLAVNLPDEREHQARTSQLIPQAKLIAYIPSYPHFFSRFKTGVFYYFFRSFFNRCIFFGGSNLKWRKGSLQMAFTVYYIAGGSI